MMMNNKKWDILKEGYSIPNTEMNPIFYLILSDNGTNLYDYIPTGW